MSEDWKKDRSQDNDVPFDQTDRYYMLLSGKTKAEYEQQRKESLEYYNRILDEQEAREDAEKRRKSKEFWSSPKNQALGCFIALPTVMFAIVLLFCLYWFIALISGQGAATFLTLFTLVGAIALLVYLVKRHPPS